MNILKVEWFGKTEGYFEVEVNEFCPCTISKAKKVFPLVATWCSTETIEELNNCLVQKRDEMFKLGTEAYNIYLDSQSPKERKRNLANVRKYETLIKRCDRNIELLTKCIEGK